MFVFSKFIVDEQKKEVNFNVFLNRKAAVNIATIRSMVYLSVIKPKFISQRN